MIVELLVSLKSLDKHLSHLVSISAAAAEWDTVVRVSADRARSLTAACSKVRPMLVELVRNLERVEVRALAEAQKLEGKKPA